MSLPTYDLERSGRKLAFGFVSRNKKRGNPILKVIAYAKLDKYGVSYYNLGFGDFDPATGRVNDLSRTDNGDMRKVLATVVSTLKIFFKDHPDETVHIDGSDETRMAYYLKLVNDYSSIILALYRVQGCYKGVIEDFQGRRKYEFILVSKKARKNDIF